MPIESQRSAVRSTRRLLLNFEGEAEVISTDVVLTDILAKVPTQTQAVA
jgi:hypothetical protein